MALRFPDSVCPICDELVSDPVFATSGVFFPPGDPLSRFCDACMHWSCYATWEHRERFARAYVEMWIECEKVNPYWARVLIDDLSFVTINPSPPVMTAHVHLFRTGSRIDIPLDEWQLWMRHEKGPAARHPLELSAWDEALRSLREALPTTESLRQAADWTSKHELVARNAIEEQERSTTIAIYNRGCEDLRRRLKSVGLDCPHCHARTTKIRFYDKSPEDRSYFVCQLCGRSLRLEDFIEILWDV